MHRLMHMNAHSLDTRQTLSHAQPNNIPTLSFSLDHIKVYQSLTTLIKFICVFQCQIQPSPPVPSRSPPQAQCPPALALLPPHPPVLVQPGFLHKFLLVAGTMQSSGLLWPTDSPPPPPLAARPPNSSDTCPERFHQDFAASRTIKCY